MERTKCGLLNEHGDVGLSPDKITTKKVGDVIVAQSRELSGIGKTGLATQPTKRLKDAGAASDCIFSITPEERTRKHLGACASCALNPNIKKDELARAYLLNELIDA